MLLTGSRLTSRADLAKCRGRREFFSTKACQRSARPQSRFQQESAGSQPELLRCSVSFETKDPPRNGEEFLVCPLATGHVRPSRLRTQTRCRTWPISVLPEKAALPSAGNNANRQERTIECDSGS